MPFPLTEVQAAYWVGRGTGFKLGGIDFFTLLEIAIGQIAAAVLEDAWNQLVVRHPMLRAELTGDGQQHVRQSIPRMSVDYRDFSALSGASLEQARQELHDELHSRVTDPTQWPLFALCVCDVRDGERRLIVAYDPIVCDAGSVRLLANELAILIADPSAQLPELTLDFRDYVLGIRELRDGAAGARARDYWNRRIDTLPAAPELPVASVSAVSKARFNRRRLTLQPKAWERLQAECQSVRITPSALMMAVYASVIANWSRVRHFTLNITLFNRAPLHPDVARIVGDFTSLTLLEIDLRERRPLAGVAQEMQRQLLDDLEHRLVDGVEVMRRLSSRTAAGQVVMPVVFTSTLGNHVLGTGGLAPIGELVQGYGQTPQVYLDCQVGEWGGALHCWWDCLDDCLQPGVAEEMFQAFAGVLTQLGEDPAIVQRVFPSSLPHGSFCLRQRLNHVPSPVPEETLEQLFLNSVLSTPDAPAVIGREAILNYRDLDRASRSLAVRILTETGSRHELVAIIARGGCAQAVASLALLRAGKAFTRIDPDWPVERQRTLLAIAGVRAALVEIGIEADLPAGIARIAIDMTMTTGAAPIAANPAGQSADMTAYVMFTSGSTGVPKGVTISHRAAVNTILDINRRLSLGPSDRILAVSAATFDLSIYDLFGPLAAGGAMVCTEADQRRDAGAWLATMVDCGVTIWNSTPALMEMLTEQVEATLQPEIPHSLRCVMLSGDWIPLALPQRIRQFAPKARCIGLGGATEAAIWSTWHPLDEVEPGWPSYPYGAPLANQTTHVLNEWLQPCPDWVVGTLYIGGIGVATGYWGRTDLSEAAFITHPETGERLFKTGDLARFRPGGQLEFLGREDGQVKIRGHRIELGEIEAAIVRHEDILTAVAVANSRSLSVYCVAKPERVRPDVGAVRQHLIQLLPNYMVPRDIRVVDRLPLTVNGKVDRTALIATSSKLDQAAASARPVDELTEIVASTAASLIGADLLGSDDDFFLAGGDSISGTRLVGRLGLATGRQITLPQLFDLRTPRAIAEALLHDRVEASSRISRLPSASPRAPASSAQYRFWLLDRLHPGDPRYVIAGSLDLRGAVDVVAMSAAVSDLIARHEPLRTSLAEVDGALVQIIHPPPEQALQLVQSAASDGALAEAFRHFATVPFDLSKQIPTRFRLLQIEPERSMLQFCIHHVACDAWSLGVIADEISQLYAFHRKKAPPLAPLPLRYSDFATWEQQQLRGDRLAEARRWWSAQLSGLAPQKLAATEALGEPKHTFFPVEIDVSASKRLAACAARAGTTLYTVLLAVFAATLRSCGGAEDMLVASSVTGRNQSELDGLVGCFINLILVRIDLSMAPALEDLARQLHGFVAGALMRQELPFEEIAAAARAGGAKNEPPYAAVFVLQNTPARKIAFDELEVSMPDHELGLSRYVLHLHLHQENGRLRGALRTNAATIGQGLGSELADRFRRLSEAAAAATSTPLEVLLERLGFGQARRAERQSRLNRIRERRADTAVEVGANDRP